jgi:hypothetical protein
VLNEILTSHGMVGFKSTSGYLPTAAAVPSAIPELIV